MEYEFSSAVVSNNIDKMKELISTVDINWENKHYYNETALHRCCLSGNKESLEILLRQKQLHLNKRSTTGATPIFSSISKNFLEILKMLVQDARVAVDEQDKHGWYPYMFACWNGKIDLVKMLLSSGRTIDINRKSTGDLKYLGKIHQAGSTARDLANQRNKTAVVSLIDQYQSNPTQMIEKWREELNIQGKK